MSKHHRFNNLSAKETKVEVKQSEVEEVQTSSEEQVQESTEVESTPVVQVKETPKPEVKTSAKEQSKPQPKESFTPVFKVEIDLISYSEVMDPKNSISSEEGAKWQYNLFSVIRRTFNVSTQEEFNKEWTTILNFFNKHKDGIFNERYMFRFLENWPGSPSEYIAFRDMVFLLIQTADPKVRKSYLRDKTTDHYANVLTEQQKNTLLAYYEV